jgi:uncharacterized membrane protein YphA (DoxX/SURF4 family)
MRRRPIHEELSEAGERSVPLAASAEEVRTIARPAGRAIGLGAALALALFASHFLSGLLPIWAAWPALVVAAGAWIWTSRAQIDEWWEKQP